MEKRVKSPNKDKWFDLKLRKDRYIKIPKHFMEKIHLDNERNILLKSNNNVWFFEILDKSIEKEIVETVKVNFDKKWGFIVPIMSSEFPYKPDFEDFIFFHDDNGIGCANSAAYFVWANGKLNKESIDALNLITEEDTDEYINGILRKIQEEK